MNNYTLRKIEISFAILNCQKEYNEFKANKITSVENIPFKIRRRFYVNEVSNSTKIIESNKVAVCYISLKFLGFPPVNIITHI
jgi:hypothetical protein